MLVMASILLPMVVVSIFEEKPFFNILDYINVVTIALKQSVFNLMINKFTYDLNFQYSYPLGDGSIPFVPITELVGLNFALILFYFLIKRVTTIGDKKAFNRLAERYYYLLTSPFLFLLWFIGGINFKLFYPYIQYVIYVVVIVDVIFMMKNGISHVGIGKMRGRFTDFYVFFVLGYLLLELLSSKLALHLFLLRLTSNEYSNMVILGFFETFLTIILYLAYVFFTIPLAEILFDELNHGSSFF